MTVKEFVEGYEKLGLDNLKEEYIKSHIVNKYVSYLNKVVNCKNIANATTHTVEKIDVSDDSENNVIELFRENSIDRVLLLNMKILECYTDIEIVYDKTLSDQYDMLLRTNTLPLLINSINSNEIKMWNALLQMALDDIYTNECGITNWLDDRFKSASLSIKTISSLLNNVFENLDSNTEIKDVINSINKADLQDKFLEIISK